MKSPLSHSLVSLLAAGAACFAFAEQPTPLEPQPMANPVNEPVASVSRSDDVADAIAQALNADASLKHSKVTVQPDDNSILLTGATMTEAQRLRAGQIAASKAGGLPVVNTLASSEVVVWVPVNEKQRNEQLSTQQSAEQSSDQPSEQTAAQPAQAKE